ncbi:MAG: hypothetical protein JWP75_3221 [Frondihabitans sp.]|nr:hypothetical protein [Frondihabitans sp.]
MAPLTSSEARRWNAGGYRRAGRGDFLRLSWCNAPAFYARKPRLLRWLLPFSWLGKASIFCGWLAVGHSSSIVMTVHKGNRRGRFPGRCSLSAYCSP